MLPVSVLPVAGLLLGIGSAHFTWLPPLVSNVMAQSGGAIFGNLALIFAIGVALGVTQNDGVAALAAVVGYAVLLATMGVMAALFGYEPTADHGHPVDRDRRLRRHRRRQHRRMAVQQVLPDPAAALSRLLCRQALRADRHGAGVHRRRRRPEHHLAADRAGDRRLLALGGGREPRRSPSRSTASSSARCCRSACITSGTCRSSSRSGSTSTRRPGR